MIEFFKDVVAVAVEKGVKGLLDFVPGGKYLHELGTGVLERRQKRKAARQLEAEVKEMIGAKADAVLADAVRAVEEAAPHVTGRDKELLTQFVAGIPEAARQSLKRKDDPTGTSLPFGYTIHTAADVEKLLPQTPPRFAPGEWVPGREDLWQLVRRLGGGGFGDVWLAHHAWLNQQRAVKFCTDPAARLRLTTHEKDVVVRVMKALGDGDHPHVVPLLECHLAGDAPWLMYEYVPGGTLTDRMLGWAGLSAADRLARAVPLLRVLSAAAGRFHRLSPPLVHRDLKPANVLMAGDTPRITDWGIGATAADVLIAEYTRGVPTWSKGGQVPSILSGAYSPMYASKQQRDGEKPHPRDDVHALGVIGYQMLTGDLSAAPGSDVADELRELGVPDELVRLIAASVAVKPDRRPRDAAELAEVLRKLNRTPPVARPIRTTPPVSPPTPVPAPPVRAEPAPTRPAVSVEPPRRERNREPDRKLTRRAAIGCLGIGGAAGLALGGRWAINSFSAKPEPPAPTPPSAKPEPPAPTPPAAVRSLIPGEERHFPLPGGLKMTFCWVPPGTAQLGSPKAERDAAIEAGAPAEWVAHEGQEHRGTFTSKGFWLGKYPVTQAEWHALTGANPSHFRAGGAGARTVEGLDTTRFPVENVSWDMICKAGGFLEKLNAVGGVEKVFGHPGKFALPHEDMWEYACRGGKGNQQPFYWGREINGNQANIDGNYPFGTAAKGPYLQRPTPVGTYAAKFPHPWGMCDLHGNVWEWCENCYEQSDYRVLRGGSWVNLSHYCRAAGRNRNTPDNVNHDIGFRVSLPWAS